MSIDYGYIRAVLARFEGEGIARGYVPSKNGVALGVSGVTIGTGVDLGQQTMAGLLHMGVPQALADKFLPYLGRKKATAQAALASRPLALDAAEVKALDDAVIGSYVRRIAARYDRDHPARNFADLPPPAQAVTVSIFYQRGLGYAATAPALWQALLSGEWASAAAWLGDPANGGGYHSRRKAEGEILNGIKAGGAADAVKAAPLPAPRNAGGAARAAAGGGWRGDARRKWAGGA